MRTLFFCLILALVSVPALSQVRRDTVVVQTEEVAGRDNRPRNAAIMSAVLPGLGQIYNRRYWKLPILYGGGAVLTYFIIDNHRNFIEQRNIAADTLQPEVLRLRAIVDRDYYRRNRDLSVLLSLALYVINILDANVDAHLREFDLDDDLSLKVEPFYHSFGNRPTAGVNLTFRF